MSDYTLLTCDDCKNCTDNFCVKLKKTLKKGQLTYCCFHEKKTNLNEGRITLNE